MMHYKSNAFFILDRATVIKAWKDLRDYYLKLKKKAPSGSAASSDSKIRWKYLTSLAFLDPFLLHRKTLSSSLEFSAPTPSDETSDTSSTDDQCPPVSDSVIEDGDIDMVIAGSSKDDQQSRGVNQQSVLAGLNAPQTLFIPTIPTMSVPSTSTPGKKKKKDDPIADALSQTNDMIANICKSEDEDEAYGKSVALTLKNFGRYEKAYAKLKIQELLFKIEFGLEV